MKRISDFNHLIEGESVHSPHIITAAAVVVVEHYTYHKSGLTTKSKVSKAHP